LLSAQEALGDEYQATYWWQHKAVKALVACTVLAVIVSSSYFLGQFFGEDINETSALNITEPAVNNLISDTSAPALIVAANESLATNNKKTPDENLVAVTTDNASKVFEIESDGDKKRAVEQRIVTANSTANEVMLDKNSSEQLSTLADSKLAEDKATSKVKEKLSVKAVDGVSDDLLALFQNAIDDTEQDPQFKNRANQTVEPEVNAPALSDMPAWVQSELPSLNFQQHIYTSEGESWVKVNGRDRYEGDTISEKLVLNHIYGQKVILTFKGQQFSLPALSSW
jgi:general secretion pathway protein A